MLTLIVSPLTFPYVAQVDFSAFSPACRQEGFRVRGNKAEKSNRKVNLSKQN